MSDKVGAVMVVGGGISGVQSALDLADSGFKVYLVEKKASIGGVMAQLDKTFPTNDCSMCIMAPKLVAAGRHHNIEILNNADIEKVEGDPGNFTVTVRQNTLRVDPEVCTGCGVCAEKCPMETWDEYNEGLKRRKAIYVMYPQAVPLIFSIDKELCIGCGICVEECRAKAVVYAREDEVKEIKVGSVILCPGFDEFDATLKREYGYGQFKNVLNSIEFERLLSATGPYFGAVLRPSDGDIPAKVAFLQCIGSRDDKVGNNYCSSVCCMYALKEAIIAGEHTEGLQPHIFFMDIRAVGKEFEDYRKRAEDEYHVKIHKGTRVASVEEDPETNNLIIRYSEGGELYEEEFNMVVLSVGLCPSNTNKELQDVFGIDLNKYGFCATNNWDPLATSKEGVFVSGAFTAPKDIPTSVAEASGVAAKAAAVISEARNTLAVEKEYPEEIDVAEEEPRIGAFICHCGINIGGVVRVPEVVEYAKTLPNIVYVDQNLYTCSADTQEKIKEAIHEHNLNRILVASCTPRTHEPLFQNTIKEAGLNPYLFELANIRDQCSWIHMHEPEKATQKAKDLVRMAAAKARLLEPLSKSELPVIQTALVIGGGLAGMTAALEIAAQGFPVDIIEQAGELGGNLKDVYVVQDGKTGREFINEIISKVLDNDKITVHLNTKVQDVNGFVGNFIVTTTQGEIETGSIVVTTGAQEYKPTEYSYGQDDRVVTQRELGRMLTEKPLDAKTVAMIQCVGSRTEDNPMCSRICCSTAMNNAISIKKQSPGTDVYVFFKDIRTYGFREDLYREAGELGVKFIRMNEDEMPEVVNEGGKLQVSAYDCILGDTVAVDADMVALAAGIRPHAENEALAMMLKVPTSKDGFFLEAHMKLRPVDFATEGIYLSGLAHWPKFADETIAQAAGAAARAMTIISKDKLETEGIIAAVNEDLCDGCGICEGQCEYKAIEIVNVPGKEDEKIAVINEGLCKGCGCCVAACPSAAMEQRGFKTEQMIAMIDAALEGGD
jgi:heterodisulfide reductase subunit A